MMGAERVARQKMPGQAQPVAPVGGPSLCLADEKRGQRQQPRHPISGRRRRYGPPGAGADEGQALRRAGDRAHPQIEAVAEFGQQLRFPPHQAGQDRTGLAPQPREQPKQAREHPRVRLALGQRAVGDRAARRQHRERERVLHRQRGGGMHQLPRERAELLGEPSEPARLHHIAGLPQRRLPPRRAAARQPAMAPVRLGHHRDDGIAFAQRSGLQHDCRRGPLHRRDVPRAAAERKGGAAQQAAARSASSSSGSGSAATLSQRVCRSWASHASSGGTAVRAGIEGGRRG